MGLYVVRKSEESKGPECIGKLCVTFWAPAMNLVDRLDGVCGELEGRAWYGDHVCMSGVRRSEEYQGSECFHCTPK